MWSVGVAELTQKDDFSAGSAFENREILFNYLSRATRQQGCLSSKLEERPKAFSMEVEMNIYPHRYASIGVLADSLTLSNTHTHLLRKCFPQTVVLQKCGTSPPIVSRGETYTGVPYILEGTRLGKTAKVVTSSERKRAERSRRSLTGWLAFGGLFLAFPGLNSPGKSFAPS